MVNAHVEYDGSKLAAALIKFQADLPDIGLDSENPHFKSKFASLPKITKVVLPLLAANGLSFTAGGVMQDGQFGLSATLLHESGEERSGFFPIIATDPQKIGSAITYARRYLLASLTGIVADADDDGNAASLPTKAEQTASTAQARVAKAQGNRAPKSSGRNELNDLNTAIRKYIGTDEEKKKSVNGLLEQFKKGGLNAVGQRNKIIQELELEEILAEVQSGKFDGGV